MDTFKFKIPDIDWDGIFGRKDSDRFQPCNDGCGCEERCASDEKEELLLRLADAAIELAEANRILSDLIERIHGEV